MRLLKCQLCNDPHTVWLRFDNDLSRAYNHLHWSARLSDYIHPACLMREFRVYEQVNGVNLDPLKRLIIYDEDED